MYKSVWFFGGMITVWSNVWSRRYIWSNLCTKKLFFFLLFFLFFVHVIIHICMITFIRTEYMIIPMCDQIRKKVFGIYCNTFLVDWLIWSFQFSEFQIFESTLNIDRLKLNTSVHTLGIPLYTLLHYRLSIIWIM